MGCVISSETTTCDRLPTFDGVRVVHMNGLVEEFVGGPVTVGDVTAKQPKIVLCTPAQLCSTGFRPLRLDAHLESGKLYFLIPESFFGSDAASSPVELRALTTRLTAIGLDRRTPVDTRLVGGGRRSSGTSWKPSMDSIEERLVVVVVGNSDQRRQEDVIREMDRAGKLNN